MRSIVDYLYENLNEASEQKIQELEKKIDDANKLAKEAKDKAKKAEKEADKAEESIKSEEDFREYARNKFEEVFGDDLDEDKMNETIDGLLKDNKDAVEAGDWGTIVGMLNKSFGS
jgi:Zn-dependent M32 family carboxypeptidase